MLRKLLTLSLLTLSVSVRAQTVLYVDSSVTNSGIGTTWPAAYKTLREALLIANAGSASTSYIINIARGTYYPGGVQSPASRDTAFMITRPGVMLYGGFPSGGGSRNASSNPTILSGNVNNASNSSDNSNHIMVIAGVSGNDSIILDGLAFMYGSAMQNAYTANLNGQSVSSQRGAALYNINVSAPLLINNCLFAFDSALNAGGAIYNEMVSPVIRNSTFSDNYSFDGGAVYSSADVYHRFSNTSFIRNRADRHGGAVGSSRLSNSNTPIYQSCSFVANTAALFGGAVYDQSINSIPSRFQASSFTRNVASSGGAIYLEIDSTALANSVAISSSTFSNNIAPTAGGAVYASLSKISYLIDSTTFSDNKTLGVGGGLYLSSGNSATGGEIRASTFLRDTALLGGGLFSDVSRPTIANCSFLSNNALHGAGIYHFSPSGPAPVVNTVLAGNHASSTGGGLLNFSTLDRVSLTNCLVTGNRAGLRGGGIYDSLSSSPRIFNGTFANNAAPFGNAIANLTSSNATIVNSIIWEGTTNNIFNVPGNVTTVNHSIVQAGHAGTGNSSANPLFVAPLASGTAPTIGGNYRLQGCSPAINTGDNTAVTATLDLDGNPRIFATIVDKGAYEYPVNYPSPITGDSSLCMGNNIQLGNYTTGSNWASSDTSVATIGSNGLLTGLKIGTVTISYIISNSCPATLTKTIRIDTVNNGVSLTGSMLTSNQSGAQYQWLNCLTGYSVISGQTNQSFTPQVTGQYAVAVTRNGCTDTSTCLTVIGTSTPSVSGLATGVACYPNPTSGLLTVSMITEKVSAIRLTDLTGRVLRQEVPQGSVHTFDLTAYPAGLYLLVLSNESGNHTVKVNVIH